MTQNEKLQRLFKRYSAEHDHQPVGTRQVVEWAVSIGELELPQVDPVDILSGKMSQALREETVIDSDGRSHRVNHSWRIGKNGTQLTLWGEMDYLSRRDMSMSVAQRREQVVGDCIGIKNDVDAWNKRHANEEPIQSEFDFTADIEERLAVPASTFN